MISLETMIPVIDLILYLVILIMVLAWTFIKYPINIQSVLGSFSLKFLIPPTNA